jgi:hypothetical protein
LLGAGGNRGDIDVKKEDFENVRVLGSFAASILEIDISGSLHFLEIE